MHNVGPPNVCYSHWGTTKWKLCTLEDHQIEAMHTGGPPKWTLCTLEDHQMEAMHTSGPPNGSYAQWGTTKWKLSTLGDHQMEAIHTGGPLNGSYPHWGTTKCKLCTLGDHQMEAMHTGGPPNVSYAHWGTTKCKLCTLGDHQMEAINTGGPPNGSYPHWGTTKCKLSALGDHQMEAIHTGGPPRLWMMKASKGEQRKGGRAFSDDDLQQVLFTSYLERRLVRYLCQVKESIEELKRSGCRLPLIRIDTTDKDTKEGEVTNPNGCIVKGMGLVMAVKNRRATFYIYPRFPQQPSDFFIEIKGPSEDFGSATISIGSNLSQLSTISKQFSPTPRPCNIVVNYKVNNTYVRVTYVPCSEGPHELSVLQNEKHVIGSPYHIIVDKSSVEPLSYSKWKKLSEEEEDSKKKITRRRLRVLMKVVDFVTEKMLLTEDDMQEGEVDLVYNDEVENVYFDDQVNHANIDFPEEDEHYNNLNIDMGDSDYVSCEDIHRSPHKNSEMVHIIERVGIVSKWKRCFENKNGAPSIGEKKFSRQTYPNDERAEATNRQNMVSQWKQFWDELLINQTENQHTIPIAIKNKDEEKPLEALKPGIVAKPMKNQTDESTSSLQKCIDQSVPKKMNPEDQELSLQTNIMNGSSVIDAVLPACPKAAVVLYSYSDKKDDITSKNTEKSRERYEQAKSFFQKLESQSHDSAGELTGSHPRVARSVTSMENLWEVSQSDLWDKSVTRRHKFRRKKKEPRGIRSAPASDTETRLKIHRGSSSESELGGSGRCKKVLERFHVKDLFLDVAGEFCGGSIGHGVPHREAVLAALRSVDEDLDRSGAVSPYEYTNISDEHYGTSIVTSLVPLSYQPEFPYLSNTPPNLYRSRMVKSLRTVRNGMVGQGALIWRHLTLSVASKRGIVAAGPASASIFDLSSTGTVVPLQLE
uniref:Uncharacterized protein n=1 Tax=Timema bartmani TaxID=61472 RepID=A0A7R9I0G7_9NEOP|nr:unnamed protein product [Timema bartmani]